MLRTVPAVAMSIVLAAAAVTACSPGHGSHHHHHHDGDEGHERWTPSPASTPAPSSWATPSVAAVSCPAGGTEVSDAGELTDALAHARPGERIRLADGVYQGSFVARTPGTAAAPITLCGGRGAVLQGEGITSDYGLHLDGASYWRLAGFSVRNGQKGVVVDRSSHVVVERLSVSHVGDEAIHLRSGSTDDVVRGNVIRDTGLRRDKFGEGVYVGSATSNWCTYTHCQPDRSDRNVVEDNDIADTTAENVDVKEGTTGGVLRGNRLSGAGMSDSDSWVDVKGNAWLVAGNVGSDGATDGFQVHVVKDGWGQRNVFRDNTGTLDADGYGLWVDKNASGTVVDCSNKLTGAGSGLSTIACS